MSNDKIKENENAWACDYCGKQFNTKKEAGEHELSCLKNKNPSNIKVRNQNIALGLLLFVLLFIKWPGDIPAIVGGYVGAIFISSILSLIFCKIFKKERTSLEKARIMFIIAVIDGIIVLLR